mmetsp:Transcript_61953/g.192037  ORF Transcript_61953/g.192037 Transcript_61953/m.192037 type:complete len:297 (+) Transcript_61953:494-1384(+)
MVLAVLRRTGSAEIPHHAGVALPGRLLQGGPPVLHGQVHAGAGLAQGPDDRLVAAARGDEEGASAGVGALIHLRPGPAEVLYDVQVSCDGGGQQWARPVPRRLIDLRQHPAEVPRDLHVADVGRHHEGRPSVLTAGPVLVSPGHVQVRHEVQAPGPRGRQERREAVDTLKVRAGAAAERLRHGGRVPVQHAALQRGALLLVKGQPHELQAWRQAQRQQRVAVREHTGTKQQLRGKQRHAAQLREPPPQRNGAGRRGHEQPGELCPRGGVDHLHDGLVEIAQELPVGRDQHVPGLPL